MDLVRLFKDLTTQWNDEQKCGFCWEYDAPLTDAGVNESVMQTDPDECCPVKVFITNYSFRENKQYNPITTLLTNESIDHTFTASFVTFDRVDTNVYLEQIGHPVSESKWETILNPLRDCICDTNELQKEICELICKRILITQFNATSRINWLDNNYTGWSVTMTLRDYDCSDSECSSS